MRYMYYETIGQLDKRAAAYNDMLEEESRMIARMSNRTNGQQELMGIFSIVRQLKQDLIQVQDWQSITRYESGQYELVSTRK